MKIKKILGILFAGFNLIVSGFAVTVDVEANGKTVLAFSEIWNGKSSETLSMPVPIPLPGQIRAQYIFENVNKSNWSFGAGAGFYVWPVQTVQFSGSAIYTLRTFGNGSHIDLVNYLDLGFAYLQGKYFDAEKGENVSRHYFNPAFEYNLSVLYRMNGKFNGYAGFGPAVAFGYAGDSAAFLYGLNLNLGYRIKTDRK